METMQTCEVVATPVPLNGGSCGNVTVDMVTFCGMQEYMKAAKKSVCNFRFASDN
jgi:hypothetical protein